jgi:hypothetical protein
LDRRTPFPLPDFIMAQQQMDNVMRRYVTKSSCGLAPLIMSFGHIAIALLLPWWGRALQTAMPTNANANSNGNSKSDLNTLQGNVP